MRKSFFLFILVFLAGSGNAEVVTGIAHIDGVAIEAVSSEYTADPRHAVNIVNGAGLDINTGFHTNAVDGGTMWLSNGDPANQWVIMDLGALYDLATVRVWNYNELYNEETLNRGVQSMDILVSADNVTYNYVKTINLARAPGVDNVDFSEIFNLVANGVRYVKFDNLLNYGSYFAVGLSKVRFGLSVPKATFPIPADSAKNVPTSVVLHWTPGIDAVSHDVYIGTDYNSVSNAMRLAGDVDGDGQVDWVDMFVLAEQWLTGSGVFEFCADLNNDGNVNIGDFAILSDQWMEMGDVDHGRVSSCDDSCVYFLGVCTVGQCFLFPKL